MKLIIAGSRTFCCPKEKHDSNPDINCEECLIHARIIWKVLKQHTDFLIDGITEIVSGRARGADKLGELFADLMSYPISYFPAKWRVAGKVNMKAGFERNQEMAEYGDAACLFWDGQSSGTQDMKRRMDNVNKPVVLYNFITQEVV